MAGLALTRRVGESINLVVGGEVIATLTVIEAASGKARILTQAGHEVVITRPDAKTRERVQLVDAGKEPAAA